MVTFGGKSVDDALAAQQQKNFDKEVAAGTIKDPLPLPSSEDQLHLLSVFGDYMLHIEQRIEELATLTRRRHKLRQLLRDDSRQRGREEAAQRYKDWQQDSVTYMHDITELEAQCDRYWQRMTPETRAKYGMDWHTDPSEPRLIGKAWTEKARAFRWPVGFMFDTTALRRIHPYLRRDLDKAVPNPVMLGEEMEW